MLYKENQLTQTSTSMLSQNIIWHKKKGVSYLYRLAGPRLTVAQALRSRNTPFEKNIPKEWTEHNGDLTCLSPKEEAQDVKPLACP